MIETIQGYYAYFFLLLLFLIGFYGMMVKRNLMKKIIGMSIVQSSVILFWVASAFKDEAMVTVLDKRIGLENPDMYINPLPHTLMLTAIVVAVVTLGVSFALIIKIYRDFGTLEEPLLMERTK